MIKGRGRKKRGCVKFRESPFQIGAPDHEPETEFRRRSDGPNFHLDEVEKGAGRLVSRDGVAPEQPDRDD